MPRGRSRAVGRGGTASAATRSRIVEATLETIRTEGMLGASARAIARTGNFNQASIYYHFGSINEVVITGLRQMSEDRLGRYEKRLAEVDSLSALVQVGAELHHEDVASGTIHVLSQVMASSAGDELFAKEIGEIFEAWIAVVHRALLRAVGTSPVGAALPLPELASVVSATFIGIELLGELGSPVTKNASLFTALSGMARVVESVLPSLPPAPATPCAAVSDPSG